MLLNRANLIDAVMTDDGDTFIFGATCVIKKYVLILPPPPQLFLCCFSPDIKKDGDSITVGTAMSIQSNRDTQLTQRGMFLIALLCGGDYDKVRPIYANIQQD